LIYNLIKTPPLFLTVHKLRPPGIGIEATGGMSRKLHSPLFDRQLYRFLTAKMLGLSKTFALSSLIACAEN